MITAVTGGIGEGKSTVLQYLSEQGYKTISADSVAKTVFADPSFNQQLAELAGLAATATAHELRLAIAATVSLRRRINRLMHPKIMDIIWRSEAEFVEVPLLIETCLQGHFDQVWVVTCGRAEQQNRLELRYGPAFDTESLLNAQLPTEAKLPFADVVLRTNQSPDRVRMCVSEALQRRLDLG